MAKASQPCAHLCAEHSGLNARLADSERRLNIMEKALYEMRDMLLGRPSWTVCVMITILTSAVVGMAIALLKLTAQTG